jgi:hypothetical protein
MGNQILQRRSEISPTQIDSIVAYITRSVRDISVASRHQSATYERMTGAMQAVMEVAEQVAGDSQQTSDGADRLEQVVQQLRQLVGVSRRARQSGVTVTSLELGNGRAMDGAFAAAGRTVQAVPPQRGPRSGRLARQEAARAGAMAGAGMPSTGQNMRMRRGMQQPGEMGMGGMNGGMNGGMSGGARGAPQPAPYPGAPQPAPYPGAPQPAPYPGAPTPGHNGGGWGQMPSAPFGGAPAYGTPSGPNGGSGGSGWNVPAPNSGPAPWAGRGPNSGPSFGGGFQAPQPSEVMPGGDRRRFGQQSGPNFGAPAGMPSLDGTAGGSNGWGDGTTGSQPWNRDE